MERKVLEQISDFMLGEENTAFAPYFIGKSYLSLLNDKEIGIFNVTFEPGCRNNWHIHHGSGQILICVGGSLCSLWSGFLVTSETLSRMPLLIDLSKAGWKPWKKNKSY